MESTRKILTPEQAGKFEEQMKNHSGGWRGFGGRDGRDRGLRVEERPGTRPTPGGQESP